MQYLGVLSLLVFMGVVSGAPLQAPKPHQAPLVMIVPTLHNCECGPSCECGPACDCPKVVKKSSIKTSYARPVCIEHGCECGCLEGGSCTCHVPVRVVSPVRVFTPIYPNYGVDKCEIHIQTFRPSYGMRQVIPPIRAVPSITPRFIPSPMVVPSRNTLFGFRPRMGMRSGSC